MQLISRNEIDIKWPWLFHVYSLELSDPFTEPLYEKVLRSVKNLKNSVTSIVKAQGKTSSVGGQ